MTDRTGTIETVKHRQRLNYHISQICIISLTAVILTIAAKCQAEAVYGATERQRKASEYEIKAVYLYKFVLFVEWPEDKNKKELTIGIVGKDEFGTNFKSVDGRKIKNEQQTLRIKRFGSYRSGLDLTKCDLLFICQSELQNFNSIIGQLKGKPILTVADTNGFLEKGGMINLVKIGPHIRWEINHTLAKQANLCISSQLLRNATRVIDDEAKSNTTILSISETDRASVNNGKQEYE